MRDRSSAIAVRLRAIASLTLAYAALSLSGCGLATYQSNAAGVQMFEQGNYDAAARRFQQTIANDPSYADGYYNLASTHHRLWKTRGTQADAQQAEQLYRLCIDRNPEHREAYRGLAVLMNEQGRSQEAFTLVSNWATRSAKPAEARIELAKLYQEYGDLANAQSRLREAIEIDPGNARAFGELAALQERLGDSQQALTNYARSFDLDKSQTQIEQKIASMRATTPGIFTPATASPAARTATAPVGLPRY